MMRDIAAGVLRDLHLPYAITLISGGASHNYEIVMYDESRDSHFSIRLHWDPEASTESVADNIRTQLRMRLAALSSGEEQFGERKPLRGGAEANKRRQPMSKTG